MALGFGGKKSESSSNPSTSSPSNEKPNPQFGKDGYYGDFSGDQGTAENGGTQKRRKTMNRIDGPITKSITGEAALEDDSTDASVTIGKQMELEAGNAIKYRTCSWQKVRYSCSFPRLRFTPEIAGCLAIASWTALFRFA